jgi:hypothetical protein
MILPEVFERFAQDSPICVMARAALEHALAPRTIDGLFEATAEGQYTRTLLFSSVVDLMGLVVCKIRPAVHAAYHARAETIGVSLRAVYDKLSRLEPGVSAELVRHTARALGPVIDAMGGGRPAPLGGYRTRIIDGNHLAGTEHRLKELRATGAGALPGKALVVLDPQAMLVVDVFCCEDGHAQERSLFGEVLESVRPGDLWVADRNFCTTGFLFGIARRGGHFVIRQHKITLDIALVGQRRECGRAETGAVFEQEARLWEGAHPMRARRITVVLDEPTRDGETEIHVLTNLPGEDAGAGKVAELYRGRWTVEGAFGEMAACLHGEVETLGYPRAALFAFCVALVAYNVMSLVKAALRSVHGAEVIDKQLSGYSLADEIAGTYRGMMIAIPEAEWAVFHAVGPGVLGRVLRDLASGVRLSAFRKRPRGPKKPQPKRASGAEVTHVSTAKLLNRRKNGT